MDEWHISPDYSTVALGLRSNYNCQHRTTIRQLRVPVGDKILVVPAWLRSENENQVMQAETISKGETRYLTVAQLAELLQVSESTIYGWVDRDYIPFLMAGDLLRFDPIAIDTWMLTQADRKREKKRKLPVRMVK